MPPEAMRDSWDYSNSTSDWPELASLVPNDRPQFPTDALPPVLKDFVEAGAIATQTPPDLLACLVLSVLAVAARKRVYVQVREGWREYLNLFVMIVLESGARKGVARRIATAPIEQFEREQVDASRDAIATALSELRILEAELKDAERAAKDEGGSGELRHRASELAQQIERFQIPTSPRYLVDDATPEVLPPMLAGNDGCIGVIQPEAGILDTGARYSSSGEADHSVLLRGYSGEDLRVDRVKRGSIVVPQAVITVCTMLQPGLLAELAAKRRIRDNGMLARFLYSIAESNVGFRDCEPPPIPSARQDAYERLVRRILNLKPAGDGRPHQLTLDSHARTTFVEAMKATEVAMRPGGRLSGIRDWGAKLTGQTARIAGLLHLVDQPDDSEPWLREVDHNTVAAALRIAEYFEAHALLAFTDMGAITAVADALHVLEWIERTQPATFRQRDVHRALNARFRYAADLIEPLRLLEQSAHIRRAPEPGRSTSGRKPGPAYEVNPCLLA